MPTKHEEKYDENEAVKEITDTSTLYFAQSDGTVKNDPLGLAIGDNVAAETSE